VSGKYFNSGFLVIEGRRMERTVIGSIGFISICGAAVFFMLTFLRAVLKEARKPRVRFNTLQRTSVTPFSIEQKSPRLDRAA